MITESNIAPSISLGIPPEQRERTAQLYDIAFGQKLSLAIPNENIRVQLLTKAMQLEYAVGAFDGISLIGIAGFSTAGGSLTGGIDYRETIQPKGWMLSTPMPVLADSMNA